MRDDELLLRGKDTLLFPERVGVFGIAALNQQLASPARAIRRPLWASRYRPPAAIPITIERAKKINLIAQDLGLDN